MKRSVTASGAVILVIGALCLASCSHGGPASGSGKRTQPGEVAGGAFDPVDGMHARQGQLPISPQDVELIGSAADRALGTCMERKGFSQGALLIQRVTVAATTNYLPPAELRRSGYEADWSAYVASLRQANGPTQVDPTKGMSAAQLAAWSSALTGPPGAKKVTLAVPGGGVLSGPAVGCQAQADIAVFGTVKNEMRYQRALDGLARSAFASVMAKQAAYRGPMRRWQACMRRAGYDVDDTVDYGARYVSSHLMVYALGQGPTVPASQIQAIANADARCQESSGLYRARARLLPTAESTAATALGFTLSDYIAAGHVFLARAKRIR